MKQIPSILALIFLLSGIQSFAGRGYFGDCPAFITVGGVFYEVGSCSGTSAPAFQGTNLTDVSSLYLTYAEIQTYENSGDDVQNGDLYFRIWTGMAGGPFANIDLPVTQELGGGDEKRSATPLVNILFGLMPSTTYTLEIYFQAIGNFTPDLYHSNGGSNFTLTFTTAAVLPVSLIDFEVFDSDPKIVLSWSTALENNNSHFEIQRSSTSNTWGSIGRVTGQGNSLEKKDYKFVDTNPNRGINYYRLKQFDFDGQFEYSNVVSINFDRENNPTVYPNPVDRNLFIGNIKNIEGGLDVFIYDTQNRLVKNNFIQLENDIAVGDLLPGIYFIKIKDQTGSYILNERFVKK
jgi:hypothetical protein